MTTQFPIGTPNSAEPSGYAPPTSTALPGYSETYATDFIGSSLPAGWSAFSGTPGSDPSSLWAPSHVLVSGGLLELNTWRDPSFANNWVSGGLCQCALARSYGAYFVRSRVTGAGPTQIEMLWPKSGWPPEVDFNETQGQTTRTVATLHYDLANDQTYQRLSIDMTQWHTWGVIWTPTSVVYTVDGYKWGSATIPPGDLTVPMTLDITQQTWCASGYACPTSAQSTLVDWVAEYSASSSTTTTTTTSASKTSNPGSMLVGPFAAKTAQLSNAVKSQIRSLAQDIKVSGYTKVALVGYADGEDTLAQRQTLSQARARAVASYLSQRLDALRVSGVTMSETGNASLNLSTPLLSPSTPTKRRLVAVALS